MRDDLFRGTRAEKAQIVTPCGLMVGGKPRELVSPDRSHVDFLFAEHQRGTRRLALPRVEHADLHAKDFSVPFRGARDVANIDDEMIDRAYLDGHELILWSRSVTRLRYWPPPPLFVKTLAVRQLKNNEAGARIPDIREQLDDLTPRRYQSFSNRACGPDLACRRRFCAGLSDPAGAVCGGISAGRRNRYSGAPDRAAAFRKAWPAIRDREQARRGQQHRHRGCGQCGAGRIHDIARQPG